ncbi:hypothetical protein LTR08_006858 [Meristemomyces frigidus]|nr:hypothetical protein LTR08_006858 [Meristemomyces frigidus]
MAGRQYDIPNGYRDSPNMSPVSDFTQSSHHFHSSRQDQPSGPVSPQRSVVAPYAAPAPPPHRQSQPSPTRYRQQSFTTPDQDNYGTAAAGGGMTGLAAGIADITSRDSALRDIDNLYGNRMMSPSPEPEAQQSYGMSAAQYAPYRPVHEHTDSHNSDIPLVHRGAEPARRSFSPPRQSYSPPRGAPRSVPAAGAVGSRNESLAPRPYGFQGDGYDAFDPNDIADDGEDGLEHHSRQHSRLAPGVAAGVGAGAAAGTGAGMLGAFGTRDPSGNYGPVRSSRNAGDAEKSEWLSKQSSGKKRLKWIVGGLVGFLILAGIVGGVVGGILGSKKSSSKSSKSATSGSDYDINSSQVKALLNNSALHKVFPGMDYTPLDAQYPDCLTNPPDQNAVTLDIAMLSQLTPAVRLYGTDCNQTELVLTAIDKLGYNATLKVWLGVWLGTNATTNTRQLAQMYDVLDTYPASHFAGVIVGNEVLFRQDLTEIELGEQLQNVRKNLTARSIDLPVATSDLGDDWTAGLAADTDIVMSNVHPFFAGVTPEEAPGWAWSFWQTHDVILTGASSAKGYPNNIISEIGWPSSGGNDCGNANCTSDTEGAVASIDNLNTFMEGWVCQSLANGTSYFWFEAFDEPWKVIFNTETDQWESKWGLMDDERNVKTGLKIPDCGGQTVEKPY